MRLGYPAPTTTYLVDLGDAPCSAWSVSDLKASDYRAIEEAVENARAFARRCRVGAGGTRRLCRRCGLLERA